MLKAGRGRVLVDPIGNTEDSYETEGGIVVPRPKPVRKTKGGELEHAPIMRARVLDVGEPDQHAVGGAPTIEEGDLVLYYEQHAGDLFHDGMHYHVVLALNILAYESK